MHAEEERGEVSSPGQAGISPGDGHQLLIREVNEQIEKLNGEWDEGGPEIVLCECAQAECLDKIEISADAYERIRHVPLHFVVKPDHVVAEGERVVAATAGYVVVEKLASDGRVASYADREAAS
ncbi:MAG: hypothetical protein ACJ75G_02205 [Gaiellaceae bacterium]